MGRRAPEVSIVIPSFRVGGLLDGTLTALRKALAGSSIRTETLVVDDASGDGSAERVTRRHPGVRLLVQPRNRGFGTTCNLGVEAAAAPRVFLLNSDVRVHDGFLDPLVEQLDTGDRFAAASLTLDGAGRVGTPNQVTPCMERGQIRLRSLDLAPLHRSGRLEATGPMRTLYGAGCALLVRRDRFRALGGFANAFAPYYYEDTDLGWRAWRRGWESVVEPRSRADHSRRGSIAQTQPAEQVRAIRRRNRFLLVWRNLVDPEQLRRTHLAPLPGHLVGALLRTDPVVWVGLQLALGRRRGLADFRAAERASASLTDREIFQLLERERRRVLALLRRPLRPAPASPWAGAGRAAP